MDKDKEGFLPFDGRLEKHFRQTDSVRLATHLTCLELNLRYDVPTGSCESVQTDFRVSGQDTDVATRRGQSDGTSGSIPSLYVLYVYWSNPD